MHIPFDSSLFFCSLYPVENKTKHNHYPTRILYLISIATLLVITHTHTHTSNKNWKPECLLRIRRMVEYIMV